MNKTKLLCTKVTRRNNGQKSEYESKAFIAGKVYPAQKTSGGYMIVGEQGLIRFIGSSMTFLVMNNDNIKTVVVDNAKAYFEEVK